MILLYVFGAVTLINCAYYLLFAKFSFSKISNKTQSEEQPVSLIVCAKNEAENLQKHIPFWLNQTYSNYEIILINDASVDDTLEVMEHYAEQDSRIQIVNVKNNEAFWGNKKYALTLGIKRAKNDRLVFTDADCYPASEEWLSKMVANFSDKKQLILGYGAYERQPGFLNKLIRFETLMTAVQYFSYAQAGTPYMGVGRNLGYTSRLFYEKNGFMSHIKVVSGDDDLFVNEAATSENTAICITPEAFTYSLPKEKREKWFRQKRRHYTTAKLYKPMHKFLLGLYYFANLLFWILSGIILFTPLWMFGLGIILTRFLIQYTIIGKAAGKLKEKDLIIFIPFFELFLILTQLSIFISNRSEKNTQWK
ncbi:glycosyltransferase [Aequorivita viscosa]|uniref:Glycosyltransferase, catalytic subunit of cellulose synthase and poly-beta-1,6-N-acetylglucosamine synthase n=1 Tax=Aequorivita viscosa TaxID=797419 RepID=A0A1M6HVA2_9FLAO|nr:glycosyltransferase [Aequorivita viscosa]SDW94777.1 Glycosyltransferase, catalytic subunit of cellulose synthase and poly-beta-1,6-N-acetylglucosamine synthase [Aequorivita viscosa]SHJ26054.1 Glycosyltransferase, catalytic subunit of cellulose synthase and poly-beta-1,6-N-acetylglucosamine synthase [Aequorivita viscosa]